MNFSLIIILALIALGAFIVHKIRSKFKAPKVGCMALVTGGVKTGKSTFALYLAITNYKRVHRAWKIRSYIQSKLGRVVDEEPLLYSNVPLACDYVLITKKILLREERVRYKSVMYVNEASLVADSQLVKDMDINERLLLFNKLVGHSTHGGMIIYDTQCIADLHYSIKRCISEYFYIHHLEKHIPFFLCAKVREERYSDDNSTINSYNEDVEDSMKKVLMSKRIWKKFDAYSFSYLTDNLPCADKVVHGDKDNLKATNIVSFRQYKSINVNSNKESDKNVNGNNSDSGRKESNIARSSKSC